MSTVMEEILRSGNIMTKGRRLRIDIKDHLDLFHKRSFYICHQQEFFQYNITKGSAKGKKKTREELKFIVVPAVKEDEHQINHTLTFVLL
jgi:hypothetical protein